MVGVTHQLIADVNNRKITFNRRSRGLMKILNDLTILCGVPAFAIVYPEGDNKPPVIWPSSRSELLDGIRKFNQLTEIEKRKHMETQLSLNQRKVEKEILKLRRIQQENKTKEISWMMEQLCFHGKSLRDVNNIDDLNRINDMIELKMKQIESRIDSLKKSQNDFYIDPFMPSSLIRSIPSTPINVFGAGENINVPTSQMDQSLPYWNDLQELFNNPVLTDVLSPNPPVNDQIMGLGGDQNVDLQPSLMQMLQQEDERLLSMIEQFVTGNDALNGDRIDYFSGAHNQMQQNMGLSYHLQMLEGGQSPYHNFDDYNGGLDFLAHQIQMQAIMGGGETSNSVLENNNSIDSVGFEDHMNVPAPNQMNIPQ